MAHHYGAGLLPARGGRWPRISRGDNDTISK